MAEFVKRREVRKLTSLRVSPSLSLSARSCDHYYHSHSYCCCDDCDDYKDKDNNYHHYCCCCYSCSCSCSSPLAAERETERYQHCVQRYKLDTDAHRFGRSWDGSLKATSTSTSQGGPSPYSCDRERRPSKRCAGCRDLVHGEGNRSCWFSVSTCSSAPLKPSAELKSFKAFA